MQIGKILKTKKVLTKGLEMPVIGLGTHDGKGTDKIVYESIKCGYRLIDTAWVYQNESEVGKGIKRAINDGIVKREDLFIVTKLWNTMRDNVKHMLKTQLESLQLDYIDLYLIHWPTPKYTEKKWDFSVPMYKVWDQMETMVENKLARSIGISNFNTQLILDLLCYAKIKPVVNQVEVNPYFTNEGIRKTCKDLGISVMAFNPLHKGKYLMPIKEDIFADPTILELSKKYDKSPAQIILNWLICQDLIIIPKTSSEHRLYENFYVLNFQLEEEDIQKISALNKNLRYCNNYEFLGGLDPFS